MSDGDCLSVLSRRKGASVCTELAKCESLDKYHIVCECFNSWECWGCLYWIRRLEKHSERLVKHIPRSCSYDCCGFCLETNGGKWNCFFGFWKQLGVNIPSKARWSRPAGTGAGKRQRGNKAESWEAVINIPTIKLPSSSSPPAPLWNCTHFTFREFSYHRVDWGCCVYCNYKLRKFNRKIQTLSMFMTLNSVLDWRTRSFLKVFFLATNSKSHQNLHTPYTWWKLILCRENDPNTPPP